MVRSKKSNSFKKTSALKLKLKKSTTDSVIADEIVRIKEISNVNCLENSNDTLNAKCIDNNNEFSKRSLSNNNSLTENKEVTNNVLASTSKQINTLIDKKRIPNAAVNQKSVSITDNATSVRSKKIGSFKNIKASKSNRNRAIINSKIMNKISNFSDVNCPKNNNNALDTKLVEIKDNNEPSKSSLLSSSSSIESENFTNTDNVSIDASKQTNILINKEEIPITDTNNKSASLINNAYSLQQISSSQASHAMGFPPKIVFIEVAKPSETIESIKTIQNTPSIYNNDVPLAVTRDCYDNTQIRILSVMSLASQPVISQKDISISANIQQEDKNLKRHRTILPKDQNKTIQPNISPQQNKDTNSKNDKSENIASDILPQGQSASTVLNILNRYPNIRIVQSNLQENLNVTMSNNLIKDKNVTTMPNFLHENQNNIKDFPIIQVKEKSVNIQSNVQPKTNNANIQSEDRSINTQLIDQNASTQSNDQTTNKLILPKKEDIANEILNTKFLPIKPKPSDYQGPSSLIVAARKKSKAKWQPITSELYRCKICEKNFSRAQALSTHLRKFHLVWINTGSGYNCRVCGRILANSSSRFKHEKRYHPDRPIQRPYYKCPECLSNFQGKKSIQAHMSSEHSSINLEPQNITFNSEEEFDTWRTAIERDTASYFIVRNKHIYKNYKKLNFVCHRTSSTTCKIRKSIRKRNLKYKGSSKTGLFCPAFIAASIFETSVQVTFNLTHLGHDCDIEHISMRKRITSNLSCNLHCCRVCKKVFSLSTNRRLHEKSVHGLDTKYELAFKCPLCLIVFPFRKRIMHHLSKFHKEVDLQVKHLTFASLKEVDKWKLSMEQETKSEYILDQAYQKTSYSFRRFSCHLSGNEENELFCPANVFIKLSHNETNVEVSYTSTHIGPHKEISQTTDHLPSKNSSLENQCLSMKDNSHIASHKEIFQTADHLPSENSLLENQCLSMKDSHNAAEKIFKKVDLYQNQENSWILSLSEKGNYIYEVKQLDIDPCHICKFRCSSCNVCSHQFKCNCSVFSLKIVCIHIHIIWLKLKQHNVNKKNDSDNSCLDTDVNFYRQEDHNSFENNILQEIRESDELKCLKNRAFSTISELIVEIKNCNDEAKLKVLNDDLSNFKKKINTKNSHVQKERNFFQKRRRVCHADDNENHDDVL